MGSEISSISLDFLVQFELLDGRNLSTCRSDAVGVGGLPC